MARQKKGTGQDRYTLTDQQMRALDLVIVGTKIVDIANEIGVTRETVSRWINDNPIFIATLNEKRRELYQASQDRMLRMLDTAYDTLFELLGEDSPPTVRLRAAQTVIQMCNEIKDNVGPAEPDEVAHELNNQAALKEQGMELDRLINEMSRRHLGPEHTN